MTCRCLSRKSSLMAETIWGLPTRTLATYSNSGTYEIIWEREAGDGEDDDFKPIAPDGVVKFFGRVNDGLAAGVAGGDDSDNFGPFKDIGANVCPRRRRDFR